MRSYALQNHLFFLGHICSSWRRIALSTPQLWSSLHVAIPASSFLQKHVRSTLMRRGEAVKTWLGLSGSRPPLAVPQRLKRLALCLPRIPKTESSSFDRCPPLCSREPSLSRGNRRLVWARARWTSCMWPRRWYCRQIPSTRLTATKPGWLKLKDW